MLKNGVLLNKSQYVFRYQWAPLYLDYLHTPLLQQFSKEFTKCSVNRPEILLLWFKKEKSSIGNFMFWNWCNLAWLDVWHLFSSQKFRAYRESKCQIKVTRESQTVRYQASYQLKSLTLNQCCLITESTLRILRRCQNFVFLCWYLDNNLKTVEIWV